MAQVETKLSILADGLNKKELALKEIADITENQGTVLASELLEDEKRAFIVQMNREKQAHIKTVINCDNLFESVLKEIGPELDSRPDLYKPQIAELQKRIRRVMDLDVRVRVLEDQNNQLIQNAAAGGKTVKSYESVPAPELEPDSKPTMAAAPTVPVSEVAPATVIAPAAIPAPKPFMQDGSRLIKAYEKNSKKF